MNIFSFIKKLPIIMLQVLVISCEYLDIPAIFCTDTADNRFEDNKNYFDHPAPEIKDVENFSFFVVSDTHYYKSTPQFEEKLNKLRQKYNADFLIVNGDISQSGLEKQFNLFLEDMKNYNGNIYPVLGNHDVYHNGSKIFGRLLGKFIYSFEIGNTKLIFLDTATGTFGKKQKQWYENELSHDKQCIVFTHYNFVTGTVQELTSVTNAEDEYYFFDINSKYNVKYVISGHLHQTNVKNIRGVTYRTITTLRKKKDAVLLVSINETGITTSLLDLPEN
ncbi:MAG: metallophosphoesterase [Spirochaetales bacterium]|nr:metallophosphoesterase [Spirochaetales bacterium]